MESWEQSPLNCRWEGELSMEELDFFGYERQCAALGKRVAGADEAGRGPLAGPVVAAAVILPTEHWIEGINDSKKLTEKKREALYSQIMEQALSYGIGIASVEEIEQYNILEATRLAFARAIGQLEQPFELYTDYITGLSLPIPYTALVKGDAKVYSIAAASVLAKVTRDHMMVEYAREYPEYGFEKHKGYGTEAHRKAILQYGPCPQHRLSFLKKLYAKP